MLFNRLKIPLLSILCLTTMVSFAQNNNNRRVLLFTDTQSNPTWMQQKQILESNEAGCLDRDIVIETYVLNKTDKTVLTRYNISSVPFTFLLIGKDGHVALRSFKTVPNAQLFALIDGMPMRRDEMRRKRH